MFGGLRGVRWDVRSSGALPREASSRSTIAPSRLRPTPAISRHLDRSLFAGIIQCPVVAISHPGMIVTYDTSDNRIDERKAARADQHT